MRAESDIPPIPPADLMTRVTPQFPTESRESARIDYHEGGIRHLRQLQAAAELVGQPMSDAKRLLDFGSGPGRLLRLLEPLSQAGTELHGVDVDPELIDWAQKNLAFAEFTVGPHEPPLPYPDGHFDFVLNHSVFTHIDRERQDMWLAELHRVTAPGALLLLTVHSARQWNEAVVGLEGAGADVTAYRHTLETEGVLFIPDDNFIGTTHPDWYHTAFHAPWHVFEHWTQWFRLRAYVPEGSDTQDLIVLERLAEPDPMLAPIGHGTAQPAAAGAPAASAPAADAVARARHLLGQEGARQKVTGQLRHRAMRGELARYDAVVAALAEAVETLSNEVEIARRDYTGLQRTAMVLRASLDEQAQRAAHATAELRQQLDRLGDD